MLSWLPAKEKICDVYRTCYLCNPEVTAIRLVNLDYCSPLSYGLLLIFSLASRVYKPVHSYICKDDPYPQLPISTPQLGAEKLMFGRRDFYDFTARMCLGIKKSSCATFETAHASSACSQKQAESQHETFTVYLMHYWLDHTVCCSRPFEQPIMLE